MRITKLLLTCLGTVMLLSCGHDDTVYVSSSRGDDSNDGKSVRHPVRTIGHALELGKDIRLKDTDVFFESINSEGFSLSAYHHGNEKQYPIVGDNPVISGFKIIPPESSEELWERGFFDDADIWHPDVRGQIYRLDLAADKLEGNQTTGKSWNIGMIYDPAADTVYGRKCQMTSREKYDTCSCYRTDSPYRYLTKDYDFYQKRDDYRYVYVFCSDSTLLLERELWLSSGVSGVSGSDYSVTGIDFKGLGQHGCTGGSNITIKNCSFDLIGGSFLNGYKHWVRFGNGVEFWAGTSAQHNIVTECKFSRVFDTATTIQGWMSADTPCGDIHFTDNVIRNCRQDFETWINSSDGTMPYDCSFTGNKGYDCGDNGFETQEYNNCHLLHYVNCKYQFTDIDISDNDFYGGASLYYASIRMDNEKIGENRFHCAPGDDILHCPRGIVISAPYPSEGKFVYPGRLSDDGSVIYEETENMEDAVKATESLVNDICGGGDIRLIIESEVAEKVECIKRIRDSQRDGFFFWTDSHVKTNMGNAPMYLRMAVGSSVGQKVIFGGDCMPAFVDNIEDCWSVQKMMNEEIMGFATLYSVRGNHDFTCKFSPERSEGITWSQEKTASAISGAMNGNVYRNGSDPGCCYYYFDTAESKLRYIVFDTTDSVRSEDTGFGTIYGISDRQFDWIFTNAVLGAPSGYSLVILSHIPANMNLESGAKAQKFSDAVAAIANHTDFELGDKKYMFSEREDLNLLFVLSGHHHNDLQFFTDDVLQIVTACDACYRDFIFSPFVTNRDTDRSHTELCQALDYVSISKDSRTVTMTRLGSGDDRVYHLERINIRQGHEKELRSSLKGACSWCSYDGKGNQYISGPHYSWTWVLSSRNVQVSADGRIKGLHEGEAIVVASCDGIREFFLVKVDG